MHQDPSQSALHAHFPTDIEEVKKDRLAVRKEFRRLEVPQKLLENVSTRALLSGRRQTGEFKSNRDPRWNLVAHDPQFGTQIDCYIIEIKLLALSLQFDNAPAVSAEMKSLLEQKYLGEEIVPGVYRDSLLLERMDFNEFVNEAINPTHGSSNYHLGHEDPTMAPKHVPNNISWRSHRSNLIQGNMTLRNARIYFVRLIARYFELGEIHLS